jgi:hypothetical protein
MYLQELVCALVVKDMDCSWICPLPYLCSDLPFQYLFLYKCIRSVVVCVVIVVVNCAGRENKCNQQEDKMRLCEKNERFDLRVSVRKFTFLKIKIKILIDF